MLPDPITLTWNTYSLAKNKAQCPICGKWLRLLKNDRLWPHGPANRLCNGSWATRTTLVKIAHTDGLEAPDGPR